MTTLSTRARAGLPGVLGAIAQLLTGLMQPIRRRKTFTSLSELDDHLLKDIGLTRFDVETMRRHW